jgi:glycosyltransferase involved in cell wall biosynthesis
VADLAPVYADADAVVVPLRAGGGTRIKILEAFVHRRPVVSTSLGAEGLEVEHHRHLLLADTPEDFAAQCARLAGDPALRESLTAGGFELASTRHTVERVRAALHDDP